MRKGISPVIATVIIVAVAIAISIAVAGWLMGLWGGFGATEQLQVMPTSTLEKTGDNVWTLTLNVKNSGSKDAVISKIELVGVGSTDDDWVTITNPSGASTITVNQGSSQTITIEFDLDNAPTGTSITPGTQYLVKVYTESGNVYQGYVTAQG